MVQIPKRLLSEARKSGIVVFAGAGVSAGAPSSLPGWYQLNEEIVEALGNEIERYLGKAGYTKEVKAIINKRRKAHQFPPDYQAQILAENAGEDYFRALQSLDVSIVNQAHIGIAQLAKQGIVKAIITTNFDQLIEKSLEAASVPYEAFYEPIGYERCAQLLVAEAPSPLPIIKLHGSVVDHRSMIDTLKQRLLGRNEQLLQCVSTLLESYLSMYLGFSAADLETSPNYLNIISSAARSPGLVYVRWPGSKGLSTGAALMTKAYGEKASVVVAELGDLLPVLGDALNLSLWEVVNTANGNTIKQVRDSLHAWASKLNPSDAVVCLAGTLEAIGETTAAFEVLHRFWNNVIPSDREGPAFERYRLMHGRLGMGTGIMSLAEDLNMNRGMESIQNLLRVSDQHPQALAWAGLAHIWAGRVNEGMGLFYQAQPVYTDPAATLEHKADVWLAFGEALFLRGIGHELNDFIQSWGAVNATTIEAGDLPRQARVASFQLLLFAEFMPAVYDEFYSDYALPILEQARRLNDPVIDGFEKLARGRNATKQRQGEAAKAFLSQAINSLLLAGRRPWVLFAQIEYTKALMDLQAFDEAVDLLDDINNPIERYPVLSPFYHEARGQYHQLIGREDITRSAFELAIEDAERMSLDGRADVYRSALDLI